MHDRRNSAAVPDGAGIMDKTWCDGILNVDKPRGWTSHDVVAKVRGLLNGKKVGHAGTLDPAATGVLPILVGRATRIAEYLLEWDKEYRAVLRMGETTDTQDASGMILTRCTVAGLSEPRIRSVVAQFQGPLSQLPPMYSAIKVGGAPLYKAARSGKTVARELRRIMIHHIEVTGTAGRDVALRVVCSKGTYVRTLCADIGNALGVGGHLYTLERTRVGPLTVSRALTIDGLSRQCANGGLAAELISLDEALSHLPQVVVAEEAASRLVHGVPVPVGSVQWGLSSRIEEIKPGGPVRLKNTRGRLLALGRLPIRHTESAPMGMPAADSALSISKVLVEE